MKKLLVILILILSMFNIYAQDQTGINQKKHYTIHDIQRNSLYVEYQVFFLSAIYERTIPIGNKVGIIVGGGILQGVAWYYGTNMIGKTAFILGGRKHFFEGGIALVIPRQDMSLLSPILGYRYQSHGGFLFRADVTLIMIEDNVWPVPLPGLSLGYSF